MMNGKFFCVLWCALAFFGGKLNAQNVYMTVDEQVEMQQKVNLDGKASAVFISSMGDLVIVSNRQNDVFTQKQNGQIYEYEVLIDVKGGDNGDRTFKVMRKNSALTKEIKKIFKQANQRYYFKVEEVANPIVLNEQGGRGESYFEEGKACVEFTTTLENLQVKYPPKLPCTIKHSTSEAGAYITSVIIDMVTLDKVRKEAKETAEAYNELDQKLQTMMEASESEWAQLDTLEKKAEIAEAAFTAISYLTVYTKESNQLYVPIEELGFKQKVQYGILSLREKVYERSYVQYIASASEAEKSRRFNTAQQFYEQAANAPDATEEEKASALERATEMKECTEYWNVTNQVLKQLKEYKEQGETADYDKVEECYNIAIENYEKLYKVRNDKEFQRRAVALKNALDKLGLVVEGNVVKTKMKQGILQEETTTDVTIYACINEFNKNMEKGRHGIEVGKVDSKGNFRVQIDRHIYAGLLFVPQNGKNNTWVSLKEQKHLKTKVRIKD